MKIYHADLTAVWTSSVDGDLPVDTTPDSEGMISDYGYLTESGQRDRTVGYRLFR